MHKILAIILIIIDCIIGSFGAIYLKKGSSNNKTKQSNIITKKNKIRNQIISLLKNKNLIKGILLYALAATLLVVLLKYNNLNFIYPLTSITYIFTILLSSRLLNEKITKTKWVAILLIIFGNILITL